jgi:hypothetical protein
LTVLSQVILVGHIVAIGAFFRFWSEQWRAEGCQHHFSTEGQYHHRQTTRTAGKSRMDPQIDHSQLIG